MKTLSSSGRNSSFVSIRKAPAQNVLSDTNRDEKAQTPILDINALRTIGGIVRSIKKRVEANENSAQENDPDCCGPGNIRTATPASQDSREDYGREEEQNK